MAAIEFVAGPESPQPSSRAYGCDNPGTPTPQLPLPMNVLLRDGHQAPQPSWGLSYFLHRPQKRLSYCAEADDAAIGPGRPSSGLGAPRPRKSAARTCRRRPSKVAPQIPQVGQPESRRVDQHVDRALLVDELRQLGGSVCRPPRIGFAPAAVIVSDTCRRPAIDVPRPCTDDLGSMPGELFVRGVTLMPEVDRLNHRTENPEVSLVVSSPISVSTDLSMGPRVNEPV